VDSATRNPEPSARILPGTLMRIGVPPSMVGPYLSGQRAVVAGYAHRANGALFRGLAEAYQAFGLAHERPPFAPDSAELHFLQWFAREIDGYVPVTVDRPGPGDQPGREYFLEPVTIPVGATLWKVSASGAECLARYDGLAWYPAGRED
jgi:hypothetical protein